MVSYDCANAAGRTRGEKLSRKLMIFLVVVIAVWARQSCASSVVTAKIVNFGVYGYGNIQLELDVVIEPSVMVILPSSILIT